VKELSEACRKQGIEFGAYYSVTDWYNPDWPVTSPGGKTHREKSNLDAYEKYLQGQITELIKNYGPLLTIWNDVPAMYGKRGADTIKLVRSLQPNILINNRTGDGGDYLTPEQTIGGFQMNKPWESCMTVSAHNHWAWGGAGDGVKSPETCIAMLARCAGGDGNMLLNVGPRPDGVIDPAQAGLLAKIGQWLTANGESIYGTRGGPYKPTPGYASTRKGNNIYLHIFTWDKDGKATLPQLPVKIVSASTLQGGAATAVNDAGGLVISAPPADGDTVVKLTVEGDAMQIAPIAAR
jgi:alpha-L-fucosidase